MSWVAQAPAEPLTVERLFADPPLSGLLPQGMKMAPDGTRVTFLRGRPENALQLDLWEYAIADGREHRLVDSLALAGPAAPLPAVEQARRERQRTAALSGILEYQFAADGRSILFVLEGSLYLRDLAPHAAPQSRKLVDAQQGFITDPRVSPRGSYVSFVRDHTLFALDLRTGVVRQVTPHGDERISYAAAEFVAEEEMDRHTGYWWSPDDRQIAYARVDVSRVSIQRRAEIHAERVDWVEQRYPAAGGANAEVSLWVARLPVRGEGQRGEGGGLPARVVPLGPTRDIYLARVQWANDHWLSFQVQSRDQRHLYLRAQDTRSGAQRSLLRESSRTWVNLHDDLHFLHGGKRFLWSSERSGTRQLYLYDFQGKCLKAVTREQFPVERVLMVDESTQRVFAQASGPDPLQQHVYAFSWRGRTAVRISDGRGWHEAVFPQKGGVWIDTYSSPEQPPSMRLRDLRGRVRGVLAANVLDGKHPYAQYAGEHVSPRFGTLAAEDGQRLHFALFRPVGFNPRHRYPVIIRFYGGPGRQFVRRDWTTAINTGVTDLLTQYWVRRGYLVFALDNRGTPRRGKAFEDALHAAMGVVDVADQRHGIAWLRQQPWVDSGRIGVFGWSYGGYLSLMLLAQAADWVEAAVAVAPVTDWRLYDTHYTERYLGDPNRDPAPYDAGNVLRYGARIRAPLLLVHGMADDNVLFTHSTALMAQLQARAYPFDTMVYPGGKHGLVGSATRTHVYRTVDAFLARTLRPDAAKKKYPQTRRLRVLRQQPEGRPWSVISRPCRAGGRQTKRRSCD